MCAIYLYDISYKYIYIFYHIIYIYIQIIAIMAIMDVIIIISFMWATQWMVFATTHHDFGDDLVRELSQKNHKTVGIVHYYHSCYENVG